MIDIKWLEFQGIGRFVEKQRIDFTSLGDLTQVDGVNKNTGGSSGAGKSTVFQALEYLFGLNARPTTVLQSRLTKTSMTVSAGFDYQGKEVTVTRGKKLIVDVAGDVTTGSSKLAEEKLDEILGMPRDLFRQMLHKRQKEGGFFLKMTPKDVNEFLMDCCGLGEMRNKIAKLDSKIEIYNRDVTDHGNALAVANASLESLIATRPAIEDRKPVQEISQETVVDLKSKHDYAKAEHDKVTANHRAQLQSLEMTKPELKKAHYDTSKLVALQSQLKEYEDKYRELSNRERERQTTVKTQYTDLKHETYKLDQAILSAKNAKSEASDKALQIKKIRDSICPTCDQSWVNEQAKAKEQTLMSQLLSLKNVILAGTEAEKRLTEVNAQIEVLSTQIQPQEPPESKELATKQYELFMAISKEQENEKDHGNQVHYLNQAAMNSYNDQVKKLNEKNLAELNLAGHVLDHAKSNIEAAVNKFKNYSVLVDNYEASLKEFARNEEIYSNKARIASEGLAKAKQQLAIADELKRAIKTYTSVSFDDALASISDTATRIIRALPNMANATITLEGTKETKDGKIKEEVNAVLHNDGEEGVPLKSLSGGEESSTDLAVDLAVIDFVENKANKGINIFILDEPFTGMDSTIIEQALEVLKSSNTNKKLIIVDHNEIIKEQVGNRIVVVREGNTSNVIQE